MKDFFILELLQQIPFFRKNNNYFLEKYNVLLIFKTFKTMIKKIKLTSMKHIHSDSMLFTNATTCI